MSFRPGQLVGCVEPLAYAPKSGRLVFNKTYRIRSLGVTASGKPGVRLVGLELSSGKFDYSVRTGLPFRDAFYRASRFCPLNKRETDITVFEKLLTENRHAAHV
jgi:hypothetical protein